MVSNERLPERGVEGLFGLGAEGGKVALISLILYGLSQKVRPIQRWVTVCR